MKDAATIAETTGLELEVVNFALGWKRTPNATWDPEGWSGLMSFASADWNALGVVGQQAHEAVRISLRTVQEGGDCYEIGEAYLEGPRGEVCAGQWENA